MKNFKQFLEGVGKYVTVNYKIIIRDLKDNPTTLITDFKIKKSEDKKLEITAKGYTKSTLNGYGDKGKTAWVEFDDYQDNKTRIVWNKQFENGTKKIKVYY